MFDKMIEKRVDERVKEILNEKIDLTIDKYVKEAFKSPLYIDEPIELITRPGVELIIYDFIPRTTASFVGGYIDLGGLSGEDIIEIKISMKISKDSKWRQYDKVVYSGTQESPIIFWRDILVTGGIRFTLTQTSGIGKKLIYCFYKRK